MKYWEIIADNLSKAGFSLGWVSALDLEGRTIWIVDVHAYGKRFVVCADEKLTAFLELERAIHEFAVNLVLVMAAQKRAAYEKLTAFLELDSAVCGASVALSLLRNRS